MLTLLQIRNFTFIKHADVDFQLGMTVLTGETGAGKSVVIGALQQVLGHRADLQLIGQQGDKSEITAVFHLNTSDAAFIWLTEHDLLDADQPQQVICRRILSQTQSSRCQVNGHIVTVGQLKELGERLVNIHGQHEHHALLKADVQRQRLDYYLNKPEQLSSVAQAYKHWQALKSQWVSAQATAEQQAAETALLVYQVAEIEALNLQVGEIEQLETELKKLDSMQNLIAASSQALALLHTDEPSVAGIVDQQLQQLSQLKAHDAQLDPIVQLLNEAHINLAEAGRELQHYNKDLQSDPQRLQDVEARLEIINDVARKHRVSPTQLFDHGLQLQQKLEALKHAEDAVSELSEQVTVAQEQYQLAADVVSKSRTLSAKSLSQAVSKMMKNLGMASGKFVIDVTASKTPGISGQDHIQFLAATNAGQAPLPIERAVSGGELSRLSLAIQTLTAARHPTPTLIFDEVDVGIGGATAEKVGALLKQLSEQCQVLCITHLPQVAAQGAQHIHSRKSVHHQQTEIGVYALNANERQQELARMLAGSKISDQALAHAAELLAE